MPLLAFGPDAQPPTWPHVRGWFLAEVERRGAVERAPESPITSKKIVREMHGIREGKD
ncbi:MAG: hypothetical protein H0X24_12450 [Ktedonobacterales bacterium]|nr:hypothetical protein [Ktedonobacterales bacterium]